MIIVRIQGGLGNQLFQYAAGSSLAQHLGTICKLDVSSLHNKQLRQLELNYFSFEPLIATHKEIKDFVWFPSLYRHSPALFSKLGKNIYREPHFHFDKNFSQLTNPVYLNGYWQSEKYFLANENRLRNELTIKHELISHLAGRVQEWFSKETIAVHIRRGDYLQKKIQDYHGILTADYYNNAIAAIAVKVNNPFFCFFSDDINWVKENINIQHPHEFVSGYTKSAIEDFYLMSQCKHNIIANSSFSWWAAWLNKNTGKTVIAPQNWFSNANLDTKDLIPQNWLRI